VAIIIQGKGKRFKKIRKIKAAVRRPCHLVGCYRQNGDAQARDGNLDDKQGGVLNDGEMTIQEATTQYEAWLAKNIRVLKGDLLAKHELMKQDAFAFLRATFYRWMQLFPEVCPKEAKAPVVLAVGDLHVENYGSWRDAEGRLIWGINDFDEAFPLPYTVDLTRLAASASLALEAGHVALGRDEACAAILEGYAKGLESGGEAFVLAEKHPVLREICTSKLRDPTLFWEKLSALPTMRGVSGPVMNMLKELMPERGLAFRVAHRRVGMGSLGRERYTALADWRGGKIAREVKSLLVSACVWAGGLSNKEIYYAKILAGAVRAPDPFLVARDGWVSRRLSPYCSRIELVQLPRGHDEARLLRAMGKELANVHLGSRKAIPAVRRDLRTRKTGWLNEAAAKMAAATTKDWQEWRKGNR
jgi:hypothetical protein